MIETKYIPKDRLIDYSMEEVGPGGLELFRFGFWCGSYIEVYSFERLYLRLSMKAKASSIWTNASNSYFSCS